LIEVVLEALLVERADLKHSHQLAGTPQLAKLILHMHSFEEPNINNIFYGSHVADSAVFIAVRCNSILLCFQQTVAFQEQLSDQHEEVSVFGLHIYIKLHRRSFLGWLAAEQRFVDHET
jgi:hypothetical protein